MDAEERETDAGSSFEHLLLQHLDSLYRMAYRLTSDRQMAEDLLQEACLKAYEQFPRLREVRKIKTWLFRILRHTFLSQYRSQSKEPPLVDVDLEKVLGESAEESFDPDPFGCLFEDEIQTAFDALPVEFREVILLADIEECSYREIAEILEIPPGTVASRLYRGHSLLREKLMGYARRHGY